MSSPRPHAGLFGIKFRHTEILRQNRSSDKNGATPHPPRGLNVKNFSVFLIKKDC